MFETSQPLLEIHRMPECECGVVRAATCMKSLIACAKVVSVQVLFASQFAPAEELLELDDEVLLLLAAKHGVETLLHVPGKNRFREKASHRPSLDSANLSETDLLLARDGE
jgi:hypothetical protein